LPHERPYANELIGAHSTGPVTGGADWICAAPDLWIFAGTGMKKGDGIPGLKSNFVFNAATCWWADGLSAPPGYVRPSVYTTPKGPDPRVQRITANVLERMKASG